MVFLMSVDIECGASDEGHAFDENMTKLVK